MRALTPPVESGRRVARTGVLCVDDSRDVHDSAHRGSSNGRSAGFTISAARRCRSRSTSRKADPAPPISRSVMTNGGWFTGRARTRHVRPMWFSAQRRRLFNERRQPRRARCLGTNHSWQENSSHRSSAGYREGRGVCLSRADNMTLQCGIRPNSQDHPVW